MLKERTVALTVTFYLWKGPATISDTTWKIDIDNLLNVLFDVLGTGQQGLGLVSDDSYICKVTATKMLVPERKQQSYLIQIRDYQDEQMLGSLNESFEKRRKRAIRKAQLKALGEGHH